MRSLAERSRSERSPLPLFAGEVILLVALTPLLVRGGAKSSMDGEGLEVADGRSVMNVENSHIKSAFHFPQTLSVLS
jgi:hypothetical protein